MNIETAPGAAGERRPGSLVYVIFLLSGAAGLVYEVSWSRQIGLTLGQTAPAVALVLAAYFTGLAVGQALGARLSTCFHPLLGYGIAELAAAAWACAIPRMLAWVGSASSHGLGGAPSWEAGAVVRSAFCFVILLPTTIPLGATFPLMAEHFSPRGQGAGWRIALAYAVNTAGGLGGVLVATAFLLVVVGVNASGYLAAAISAACGLAACGLVFFGRRPTGSAGPTAPGNPGVGSLRVDPSWGWLALAAISGSGTLGLEVLYTRMFALVFHNSTYTFGAVLAVFIAGLALGAGVVAVVGRRVPPLVLATVGTSLGAITVTASVVLFVRLTGLEYFAVGDTFAGYLVAALSLVAVIVLLPTVFLGMALPAALAGHGGGRAAGRLTAVNTTAAAAGALATGFVLVPWLGLWKTFALHALLFGLTGVALIMRHRQRVYAASLGLMVAGATALVASGPEQPVPQRPGFDEEVVRRWESAYGWIDVVRDRKTGSLAVRQDLHYRHGSTGNATREYRQGRLSLLLHPRPAEVAFLGLGTGLTAAPAVADLDVEHAVVVELIPQVVEAARLLGEANLGVVDHPKVEVRLDDARHYLLRSDRRFDVIVSDLFVPWESRAGYLYTVEHYEVVRRRLKPGGVFCQWVAMYQVGPEEFELIADSFASVFPETTLWWGQFDARYAIVALVGCDRPLEVDAARLEARWEAQGRMPGGADPDLDRPGDLPGLYLGSWPARPARRLNTDEHPRLEFLAPVSHRAGATLNGPALRSYFDNVLLGLPSGGVRFQGDFDPAITDTRRQRAWQRLGLFGSPGP